MLKVGDKVRLAEGLEVGKLYGKSIDFVKTMRFTGEGVVDDVSHCDGELRGYGIDGRPYIYAPSMLVKVEEASFNVTDLRITKVVTPAKTKLRETSILFYPRTDTNQVTVKFINNGVEKTEKFDGDMSNALYEVREMILKEETSDFIKETVKACFANPTWKEQEL